MNIYGRNFLYTEIEGDLAKEDTFFVISEIKKDKKGC